MDQRQKIFVIYNPREVDWSVEIGDPLVEERVVQSDPLFKNNLNLHKSLRRDRI